MNNGASGDVLFTNGHLLANDHIEVYYTAANHGISKATFSIRSILEAL